MQGPWAAGPRDGVAQAYHLSVSVRHCRHMLPILSGWDPFLRHLGLSTHLTSVQLKMAAVNNDPINIAGALPLRF